MFQASFHTIVTLRVSYYAPPDTGVPNLQLVALERLPAIEGAVEILMRVTFLREYNLSASLCSAPPLVKGSWRTNTGINYAPARLSPPQQVKGSPFRGAVTEGD